MARTALHPYRILFATSEAHPLMKTGGLGDVSGSLPRALLELGQDIRIVMPAYHDTLARTGTTRVIARLPLPHGKADLLETVLPGSHVKTWLVDHPAFSQRPGNPYTGPGGAAWPDNPDRFALFADALVAIALNRAGLGWNPDILHGNDWQTGLAPALLSGEPLRPATVFTVHNLAYQGNFPRSTFDALGLADSLWRLDGLEFHGQMSFMKGGLAFADRITTVSPTYAREIQTPVFGYGLDGLLRHRAPVLSGILNGIDVDEWNPASDPHLVHRYDTGSLDRKQDNKTALQSELGLTKSPAIPLLGVIGRLVEQKGIDLILAALPDLLAANLQIVLLGSGEHSLEQSWLEKARQHPAQVATRIGYDETLAHRIEAGADIFLMPSRFEPCGLNQMYSQRYGTVPVVRRTGGLADTVIHADAKTLASGDATGVAFEHADAAGLVWAVRHALSIYKDRDAWRKMQMAGMRHDFSWRKTAQMYLQAYGQALGSRNPAG